MPSTRRLGRVAGWLPEAGAVVAGCLFAKKVNIRVFCRKPFSLTINSVANVSKSVLGLRNSVADLGPSDADATPGGTAGDWRVVR